MATYIIGDVQGCYTELLSLLGVIDYDPKIDSLGFVGDLVNRGKESLNTLRLIKSLPNTTVVLGNHDFHLLALASGAVNYTEEHSLHEVLKAPDCQELVDWLRKQPLIHYAAEQNYVMVHAGLPPQWDLQEALDYAAEISVQLMVDNYANFIRELYGNQPGEWDEMLEGYPRWRYIVNALTRMRFCDKDGRLYLHSKSPQDDSVMQPWFNWYAGTARILFGHWAALQGRSGSQHCEALDTGCAWGGGLTAYRVEDQRRFYVPATIENSNPI